MRSSERLCGKWLWRSAIRSGAAAPCQETPSSMKTPTLMWLRVAGRARTSLRAQVSVYLFYWCKSANTDAEGAGSERLVGLGGVRKEPPQPHLQQLQHALALEPALLFGTPALALR